MNEAYYTGPCYWKKLRIITDAVTQRYNQALESLELSINQFCILSNIDKLHEPSTATLAKAIELDRTTLVRTLKPLESRGLVTDSSLDTQRSRKLQLTSDGKRTLKEARKRWNHVQKEIEQTFGDTEIAAIESMMGKVHDQKEEL